MLILPVLDLMNGVVVRGVAGRRENYRPIVTPLCETPDPICIAEAFRSRFGLGEMYIADLDAIAGRPPACPLYRDLVERGFSLWVDAGLRVADDAQCLLAVGVSRIIAALETLARPEELRRLTELCPAEQIVFSLDLRDGKLLAEADVWNDDPLAVVSEVIGLGIRQVIVLDIAGVGVNRGPTTLELCRRLLAQFPNLSLITGGGVRGPQDLEAIRQTGAAGVLVASALHDGALAAQHFKP